jgi:hypothetical protein
MFKWLSLNEERKRPSTRFLNHHIAKLRGDAVPSPAATTALGTFMPCRKWVHPNQDRFIFKYQPLNKLACSIVICVWEVHNLDFNCISQWAIIGHEYNN